MVKIADAIGNTHKATREAIKYLEATADLYIADDSTSGKSKSYVPIHARQYTDYVIDTIVAKYLAEGYDVTVDENRNHMTIDWTENPD